MRIGVFICHCGENIARTVDCHAVAEAAGRFPGVALAIDYKYMCSDPGQNLIKNAIRENRLDAVVVGSCSPHMHEKTFSEVPVQARDLIRICLRWRTSASIVRGFMKIK